MSAKVANTPDYEQVLKMGGECFLENLSGDYKIYKQQQQQQRFWLFTLFLYTLARSILIIMPVSANFEI